MSSNKIDQCLEGIHRIELIQKDMQHDISINTVDLAEHIKRTELLEKKMSKIYAVMLIGTGVAIAHFGPDIMKLLGVLL